MKRNWIIFTKYTMDFMFVVSLLGTIFFPILAKLYKNYNLSIQNHYFLFCLIFMVAGVFGILILNELRHMMKTVLDEDCFVETNVRSLQHMSFYSFAICVCMLMRCYIGINVSILLIILVFLLAGFFSQVLSYVFAQAVAYKEENDMTI